MGELQHFIFLVDRWFISHVDKKQDMFCQGMQVSNWTVQGPKSQSSGPRSMVRWGNRAVHNC